jgi:hypothetical protein
MRPSVVSPSLRARVAVTVDACATLSGSYMGAMAGSAWAVEVASAARVAKRARVLGRALVFMP